MAVVTWRGLELETAPGHVMTPRPATEALVDAALASIDGRPVTVADVGTGSGAIAIAVAHAAPHADVWATDVNPEAVALARRNADRLGVGDRVHVRLGDLLSPVPKLVDVVVANLPYLPAELRSEPQYREYASEPETAIYAPGDGLGPYRRLLAACREGRLTTPGGRVLIQFHRDVLAADCWELERLQERLEQLSLAA
jgi:release factor glutamine methyltransferase